MITSMLIAILAQLIPTLILFLLTTGKCVSTTSEGIYTKEGNIEYVVQRPSGVIKGLIFLAHGCSHSSTDWFPKGRQCQGCIGLPIERYIVSKVLAEGYVALSMSSIDRIRKCWVPRIDTEAAVKTIRIVRNHLNVPPSAPNYLIGASSGGFFVSTLGIYLNKVAKEEGDPSLACQGISIQVASIHPRLCRDRSMIKFLPSSVFFVHMKRDEHIARAVEEAIACINDESNEKKKADEHVHASAVLAKPLKLHPSYFSNLSSHLTPEDSERYVHGLEREGFVDPSSHELKLDPRSQVDAFAKVAREAIIDISTKDSLVPDESGILELLNAAYAYHEITAEGLDEILAAWSKLQNQDPSD